MLDFLLLNLQLLLDDLVERGLLRLQGGLSLVGVGHLERVADDVVQLLGLGRNA